MNTTNNQTTTKFETGATSHAVNDLILFTDNTRELATMRDTLFVRCDNKEISLQVLVNYLRWDLLTAAQTMYKKKFPNLEDHSHILTQNLSINQRWEYAALYQDEYLDNWKKEHGIK